MSKLSPALAARIAKTIAGEIGARPGLVEAAEDSDLFLCEAAYQDGRDDHFDGIHLTGGRAGAAAAEAAVKRLLLTHIPVWTDPKVLLEHAGEEYDGHLSVAVSGVTYSI